MTHPETRSGAIEQLIAESLSRRSTLNGVPVGDDTERAARAELRALMDAALVLRRVINEDGGERSLWFTDGVARRHGWILKSFPLGIVPNETISTGPIVNGLPVLDDAARKALGQYEP